MNQSHQDSSYPDGFASLEEVEEWRKQHWPESELDGSTSTGTSRTGQGLSSSGGTSAPAQSMFSSDGYVRVEDRNGLNDLEQHAYTWVSASEYAAHAGSLKALPQVGEHLPELDCDNDEFVDWLFRRCPFRLQADSPEALKQQLANEAQRRKCSPQLLGRHAATIWKNAQKLICWECWYQYGKAYRKLERRCWVHKERTA